MYGQHLKLKVSFVDLEINAFGISKGGGSEGNRIESSIMTHLLQGRCKIHEVLRLLIIPYGQTGKYSKIHFV